MMMMVMVMMLMMMLMMMMMMDIGNESNHDLMMVLMSLK